MQAVCGRLYASDDFREAAGLATAAPAATAFAGGTDRLPPPFFVVVRENPTSGLADHFVGATSTFIVGMLAGRRVVYAWPVLRANATDAANATVPVWDPMVRTHDEALEAYCDQGGAAACPVLRWLQNTQAILEPLLQPTPRSPFTAGARGFELVVNRGIIVELLRTPGPVRDWFAARGLDELTAFGCLFHAVFRIHPALLDAHRDLVDLLTDPTRVVLGVHIRSSDSDFAFARPDQFPAGTLERQRARVHTILGCALRIATDNATRTANHPTRTLTVVVVGNSVVVRDAAVRTPELFPDIMAAATAAGVPLEVRTVFATPPRHVAKQGGGVAEAALEHWVLARARWVIKAGMSGYSTTAVFAGFHTDATVWVHQRDSDSCRPAQLVELGSQWSRI